MARTRTKWKKWLVLNCTAEKSIAIPVAFQVRLKDKIFENVEWGILTSLYIWIMTYYYLFSSIKTLVEILEE